MEFRLVQDPPTAGAAITKIEGTANTDPEVRRRKSMAWRRTGMSDQASVNDFPHQIGRKGSNVFVGRGSNRWIRHGCLDSIVSKFSQFLLGRGLQGQTNDLLAALPV